jgi:hypothetical protein
MVGGRFTRASPRSFVWILGWVLLVLPGAGCSHLFRHGRESIAVRVVPGDEL